MAGRHPRPPLLRLTLLSPSVPQLVSEKVGGAEGTKLDDDFKEMEKVMGRVMCPV